ncbi:nuclear transport factor 2 family protein [Patescibacteria group bacterium]|nr:nuclear transport factor 2 family protein [Patescibacteria group bacterium]
MSDLPHIISEYFLHKNNHNKEGLLSVFSDDALVIDRGESKEVRGKEQIAAWIDKSLSGLNLDTEISHVTEKDESWVIETIVSGDFSASPAKFVYYVALAEDKISSLDIEFAGSLKKTS